MNQRQAGYINVRNLHVGIRNPKPGKFDRVRILRVVEEMHEIKAFRVALGSFTRKNADRIGGDSLR
jgi:hypothetical protein